MIQIYGRPRCCEFHLTAVLYVQPPGRVLEAGVYTLQKTLVLKKQAELDEVDKQLALKRREYKNYMEAAAKRRSELEIKLNQVNLAPQKTIMICDWLFSVLKPLKTFNEIIRLLRKVTVVFNNTLMLINLYNPDV